MKKRIYIILSYTGTAYSKFLQIALREKYVHVSISLDRELKEVYSFGRRNPEKMFPTGFVLEDLAKISTVFKDSICQIYELEIEKKQFYLLKKKIKQFYRNKEIYKYNILGLIPINFNIKYERDHHYACSQFVGKMLQDTGICNLEKNYSIIKPRDIENIKCMNKIYEGRISDIFSLER